MVITWGGLRGAVGLALALVVEQSDGVPQNTIGNRVSQLSSKIHKMTACLLVTSDLFVYLFVTLFVCLFVCFHYITSAYIISSYLLKCELKSHNQKEAVPSIKKLSAN